jgi:putative Mn2+ efflux pump MntP
MGFLEIMIIAIGLSMDAFAVSITLGLSVTKPKIQEWLIPGIFFGFFQALMPFIGYVVGMYFADIISNLDHWVAFVLLGCIGGKMIKESFSKDDEKINKNVFHCIPMLLLAIATSIDALAAGIPFALFKINIFKAVAITGITTFCISIAGVKIGNRFGIRFKSKAELSGGIILVLLGLKILIEHLV